MRVSSEKMKIVYIIEAAGAGYKVLEVTLGNVDTYFHTIATKKWDICAENSIYNKGSGRWHQEHYRIL
nr:PREDICTED: putative inositol monophosphatase 3 isoform X4 [Tribolium castaneum]|eukprot:XP_015833238.1 PREDICTED: putative inositol monophosphatase 3 isoform X4 [Tribolium castaneum]